MKGGVIRGSRPFPFPLFLLAFGWAALGFQGNWAPAAPAVPAGDSLVRAALLADTAAVRPGEAFTLGVRLEVQPGWHVYWQSPGDSGLPTRVKFSVPPGFTVGDLRYPVPEKFTQSDGAVVYGYRNSVLLTARVTPPKEAKALLQPGARAAFAADVSWLCCENVCVPGKSNCRLELAAGEAGGSATPENQALFAEWEPRVPVPLGEKGAIATGSCTTEPSAQGAVFSIALHWETPPAGVEFFPAPEDALKLSDVTVTRTDAGDTRVRFNAEVLKGQRVTNRSLSVVVACRDDKGGWRGVRVDCPLEQLGVK